MEYTLSTILFFVGLDAALCLLVMNLILLKKEKKKMSALLDILVGCVFGGYSVWALVRQFSGIACAMVSIKGLLFYAALLLLHGYFLWESVKRVKAVDKQKGERQSE